MVQSLVFHLTHSSENNLQYWTGALRFLFADTVSLTNTSAVTNRTKDNERQNKLLHFEHDYLAPCGRKCVACRSGRPDVLLVVGVILAAFLQPRMH